MIPINTNSSHTQNPGPKIRVKQQSYNGQDGLIHSVYVGDQSGTTIKKIGVQLTDLIEKARSHSRKILILADITRLGDVNLSARKSGLILMQELDYDLLAVVGCSSISAGLVNLMIIASGRGFKIRVFDNQKEAKRWLLSK